MKQTKRTSFTCFCFRLLFFFFFVGYLYFFDEVPMKVNKSRNLFTVWYNVSSDNNKLTIFSFFISIVYIHLYMVSSFYNNVTYTKRERSKKIPSSQTWYYCCIFFLLCNLSVYVFFLFLSYLFYLVLYLLLSFRSFFSYFKFLVFFLGNFITYFRNVLMLKKNACKLIIILIIVPK